VAAIADLHAREICSLCESLGLHGNVWSVVDCAALRSGRISGICASPWSDRALLSVYPDILAS